MSLGTLKTKEGLDAMEPRIECLSLFVTEVWTDTGDIRKLGNT